MEDNKIPESHEDHQNIDLLDRSSLSLMLISFVLFFVLLLSIVITGSRVVVNTENTKKPQIEYHAENEKYHQQNWAVLGLSENPQEIDRSTIAGSIKYAKLHGPAVDVLGLEIECDNSTFKGSIECAKARGPMQVLGKATSLTENQPIVIDKTTIAGSILYAKLIQGVENNTQVLGEQLENLDRSTIAGSIEYAKAKIIGN